jgi:hypothetical protein
MSSFWTSEAGRTIRTLAHLCGEDYCGSIYPCYIDSGWCCRLVSCLVHLRCEEGDADTCTYIQLPPAGLEICRFFSIGGRAEVGLFFTDKVVFRYLRMIAGHDPSPLTAIALYLRTDPQQEHRHVEKHARVLAFMGQIMHYPGTLQW